jgi:hypothetical protein
VAVDDCADGFAFAFQREDFSRCWATCCAVVELAELFVVLECALFYACLACECAVVCFGVWVVVDGDLLAVLFVYVDVWV